MTDEDLFIISEEDFERIEQTYQIDEKDGKITDILKMCEVLGYKITPTLVKELMELGDLKLLEEEKITMRFYVAEEEKDKRFASYLKKKVSEIGTIYEIIAKSYEYGKKPQIKQETKGLVVKRISVPRFIATLVRTTNLINCRTAFEIKTFSFND
jgi:hypothetical protein